MSAVPSSAFLRHLRGAIIRDLDSEIDLALRVGVLQAAGYRRAEIARVLEASAPALRVAEARVKRAAKRLEQGERERDA